jgi:anti-sigma regulatory factor (Ser/Thr protein kinase)
MAGLHLASWRGTRRTLVVHTSGDMPRQRVVTEFRLASLQGNERVAAERVVAAVADLGLAPRQMERLETAVAEAAANAIEHGNALVAEKQVVVRVVVDQAEVCIHIIDEGTGPRATVETPDLAAKLAGRQTPRGWGLFLIRQLVDGVSEEVLDGQHSICLRLQRSH